MDKDPSAPDSPTPPAGEAPGGQVFVPVEIAQPSDLEDEEVVSQPAKLMRIASMA
jgi:hypothetical protein